MLLKAGLLGLSLQMMRCRGVVLEQIAAAKKFGPDLNTYMTEQIIQQLPGDLQQFVLATSCFEQFDANLLSETLQSVEGFSFTNLETIFETLVNNNLVLKTENETGDILGYHHLFKRHSTKTVCGSLSRKSAVNFCTKVIDRHVVRDEWDSAYAYCQRLNDDIKTAEVVDRAGPFLSKTGRYPTLLEWTEGLTDAMYTARPGLYSRRGIALARANEYQEGLDLISKSIEIFRKAGNEGKGLRYIAVASECEYLDSPV